MKNNRRIVVWVIVAALLAFLAWKLHTSHFDWHGFWNACRRADWRYLLAAALLIWSNCAFRAIRWGIFLKPSLPPEKRPSWISLLGSQFIGFTGLAIFGRIGELIRPYLVARRTGLTLPSQIAVVAVERIFDLGAFAIIFSLNLALAPGLDSLPYHERFRTMGFALAALTAIICIFVFSVRIAGASIARLFRRFLGIVSKPVGEKVEEKILSFRDGLNTLQSSRDFLFVALNSLLLWGSIAVSYVLVMRAFPAPVSELSVAKIILLMGFSVVGSIVQLPGVGGGAQALSITALTLLFGIPKELAVSAGMVLWIISTMSIIPIGLIFAKFENISLTAITRQSEEAGEAVEA